MTYSNTIKFKTRVSKDGTPVETTADIVWDDVTDEQLKALALRSVIIAAQSLYRTAEHVPATDTINVCDMLKREKGGFKATPESLMKKVDKMTPEQKAALIALLVKESEV